MSRRRWAFVAEKPKGRWLYARQYWSRVTELPEQVFLVEIVDNEPYINRRMFEPLQMTCLVVGGKRREWCLATVKVGARRTIPTPTLEQLQPYGISEAMALLMYIAIQEAQDAHV